MARNLGDKNLNDREKVARAQLAATEAKYEARLSAKDVIIKKKDKTIKALREQIEQMKEA
jgi:hypothetical protein